MTSSHYLSHTHCAWICNMLLHQRIQWSPLFSVSISTGSSLSLTHYSTHSRTPTPDWFTLIVTLALSFTCSHTHANWHVACSATIVRTHMWKRLQSAGFLILTQAVVRSGWPPQYDLWLLIFAPCTAGDYSGTPFFLPCHCQSAFTPGHVISPAGQCVNDIVRVRYGFCRTQASVSVQHD